MSQPIFYALNVGRGDTFFLEIKDGQQTKVILIDGGDESLQDPGHVYPYFFMQSQGWEQVDLLILTHLHHDHLLGLMNVIKEYRILQAVLPYPEFQLSFPPIMDPKAYQSAEVIDIYQELFHMLREQGTEILLRPPFGAGSVWQFGETTLRHLSPVEGERLPAYEILEALQHKYSLSNSQVEELLIRFDHVSNLDSSIWLVQHQGQQWLLLGGDALLPNWQRLLQREALSPQGLKVSHHGAPDAINKEILQRLQPDWLMITNHVEEYQRNISRWNDLATYTGSRLYVTGADTNTKWYYVAYSQQPEQVR